MLTNRLHPKMLCPLPHALRSMASSYVVEGCGNSVSKHLNAVYNSPPHYCWRASLKMVGLGCADLERTPFGACDSSHSLDDGHPTLYGKRMCQVTFGNILSIDVEKISPFLTV